MGFCRNWFQILALFLLLVSNGKANAQLLCPHEEASLKAWSNPATWHSGKPATGANVTIDTAVLLDEPSLILTGIVVTSSGKLVFSPSVDITLTINFIEISGEVHIGSESCLHLGKVHILFEGKFGDFPKTGKGITVKSGGTLEVHGKRKLSWTKLNGTLPKLTKSNGILYDHSVDGPNDDNMWMESLVAYVFEINAKNRPVRKCFEVFSFYPWNHCERRDTLHKMITDLTNNEVLMFALRMKLSLDYSLSKIYNAFETLVFGNVTGTSKLRAVRNDTNAYAALVYKSAAVIEVRETLTPPSIAGSHATADLSLWDKGLRFIVESSTDADEPWIAQQNFFIFTTSATYPIITLIDYVNTWEVGDRVVISSTDYDWNQAEEGTIMKCSSCNNKQAKIDLPARYTHWGNVEYGVVDMRAEVALLSRNIIFEGKMENTCYISDTTSPGNCSNFNYDAHGGHISILPGFKNVRVEGTELYHMGQQSQLGFYPIHFHMCDDTRNYTNRPYIQDNSIHHTFARCVTIHGTHGILVKDNVCYLSLGHSYFLADGGEKFNRFDGNLAIGTLRANLIPSDRYGKGIWYVFPDAPLDLSANASFMAPREASRTAISLFENNVVHGYISGLLIENKLKSDGQLSCCNDYHPLEDPTNTSSPEKKVKLIGLTAYNNFDHNAWVRGGWIEISNSSFLGSNAGLQYSKSGPKEQFIINSVFIGESNNLGEPAKFIFDGTTVDYHRSVPSISIPRIGLVFYDGPVYAENIWFKGYTKTPYYNMGAIGFQRKNLYGSSTVSSITAAKFAFIDGDSTGNRVLDGDDDDPEYGSEDGDKAKTFQDVDGSVTGVANSQIVKPYDYYVTDQCMKKINWDMAICPHDYGKIRPVVPDNLKSITHPIMTRLDTGAEEQLTGVHSADFMVILGSSKRYILHWSNQIPNPLEIYSDGIEKDKWVTFGVCLPRKALFDLFSYAPHWLQNVWHWIAASSIDELEDKTNDGKKYYFDAINSVLYFKFINEYERQPMDTAPCPMNRCPVVKIIIEGRQINYSDADCRARLNIQKTKVTLSTDTQLLNAAIATPPADIGARATRPFADRGRVDGAWSEFSSWSTCSATCGGGIQKRYRYCNNPIPHGGNYCEGSDVQQEICKEFPCPTNGVFSAWSAFSPCEKVNGCSGKKIRIRSCNIPINLGAYCNGAIKDVAPCNVCGK
ncbi:hypothetical protein ACJMK2_007744 [Sinanodonta woodiana]|uniref:G8 domain-containing protein n=1 Tax=Sinanodonta woodiana TaxID=1069815 RepID=A0ABD3VJW3_SINWO